MTSPAPRAQRVARIRRTVAAGATALFVVSLGAIVAWGRQPAGTAAAAPAAAAIPSDPYAGTSQSQDDPYSDPRQQDPGPLTSRAS